MRFTSRRPKPTFDELSSKLNEAIEKKNFKLAVAISEKIHKYYLEDALIPMHKLIEAMRENKVSLKRQRWYFKSSLRRFFSRKPR